MLQCPRGPLNSKKTIAGIDFTIVLISAAIHGAVLLALILAGLCSKKQKLEFVVYGAYSKQPCQVLFKPGISGNAGSGLRGKRVQKSLKKNGNLKSNLTQKAKPERKRKKEKRVAKPHLLAKKESLKSKGPTIRDLEAEEAALIAKIELAKKTKKKKQKEARALEKYQVDLKKLQAEEARLKKEEERLQQQELDEKKRLNEALQKKELEKRRQEKEQKLERERSEQQALESQQVETEEVVGEDTVEGLAEGDLEFTVQNEMHGVPHYNLMGDVDPRRIAMQNAVQEAISSVWSPPVGVKKGTQARVLFTVDTRGEIVEFDIEQPSGIVIFDTSITRAAPDIKFPRAVWGRSFPITYQQ